jgi:hypothetical protein
LEWAARGRDKGQGGGLHALYFVRMRGSTSP